jgi:dethiobiotin synthetase
MRVIVTGTDTGVGKTIFCAGLARSLGAAYWKPIQSGLLEETDTEVVQRLAELPAAKLIAEAYRLRTPASPHWAAEIENVLVEPDVLSSLPREECLVIEGAGGALVPITRHLLYADMFARWSIPAIVCARTSLGTINHTLMTLEALRTRRVPVLGVAFIGDEHLENARIIEALGNVPNLGRLPWLSPLTPDSLQSAFGRSFLVSSIRQHYDALTR